MGRFMLCDLDEARRFDDPEGWTEFGNEYDFSTYLVDTVTNEVIFCDSMEPEDATLDRALQPLVRYMESLTKGEILVG